MKDYKYLTPEKLAKRKLYMKKYYARKKLERINTGEFISICRSKAKKEGKFTMRRGEFIVSFK
jgi:hypothetical protein